MSHDCTLCLHNAVFPVRFVSSEGIAMGQDYHLRGACLHLAQELLASEGDDPQILDQTRTSVIKLEQIPIASRKVHYFDDEECGHSEFVQNEHVQLLSLKLEHAFKMSALGETPKSLNKEVWIGLRDEYRREAGLTQECWVKQLYNCWTNMGTGGRTFIFALGSLGVWAIQGIWDAAFYPQGKPNEKEKKAPCGTPVDLAELRGKVQTYV